MLPPFNPDATCSKCGFDKVNCHWNNRENRPISTRRPPADEWLSRRCERCGYIWDEAVLEPAPAARREGE